MYPFVIEPDDLMIWVTWTNGKPQAPGTRRNVSCLVGPAGCCTDEGSDRIYHLRHGLNLTDEQIKVRLAADGFDVVSIRRIR